MAKSTLEELLKKQAELLKQIEEAKEQEAEEIKAESVKAFEIFKQAVDKRASLTEEDETSIILELAGIRIKPSAIKSGKKTGAGTLPRHKRTSEEVAREKAELGKAILAFLKKQKEPVSAKVIREGIGAGEEKKLMVGQILVGLRDDKDNPQVKMDGQKAGAVWSFLK